MDDSKYSRNIPMHCPTCGSTEFEFDQENKDDSNIYRCISCNRELSKADLIRENEENIHIHTKEIGNEIVKDLAADFKKNLQNAFRGNKNIRIK